MKLSFWGKYAEFVPLSPNIRVEMKNTDDVYEIWMPKAYVQNIIIGKMYIEHCGTLKVINRTTRDQSEVTFEPLSSWFAKSESRGSITGTIYERDSNNTVPKIEIKGNWQKEISIKDISSGDKEFQCIWEADPEPKNWDDIYRFTIFSLQLNKLTPEMAKILPPTDCRFRPDQRALEEGDYDLATSEKHRLEEKQRAARKAREKSKKEYVPNYFQEVETKSIDGKSKFKDYIPIRDYWKDSESQNWPSLPDIY